MAVDIEIIKPENCPIKLDVPRIASLKNLSYGVLDDNYRMEFGQAGKYTIMYKSDCIGRGWEIWFEDDKICMRLPLPNTESDIRCAYALAKDICSLYNISSFVVDQEIVPFEHMEKHISSNINASMSAIQAIGGQIKNGERSAIMLFGVTNPVTLGPAEIEEIGDTMEGFEKLLHRLQSMDVFYAAPKYYQLKDERVYGVYFVGENITTVVPYNPNPPYVNIENFKGYYVYVPDGNYIPYEEFMQTAMKVGDYDSGHTIVCLTEKNLAYFAENCAVDVEDNKIKGRYWGRVIDNGNGHENKISRMELSATELSGYNHLAVFLRWAAENNMLSEKLVRDFPQLPQIIEKKEEDLRRIIRDTIHFEGKLRGYHFTRACADFAKSFYVFGRDGYPSCVDEYAEKVLGTEKYNCEEYKDEAYLFVEYNEDYYKGLSKYLDKAWKKYNR